MTGGGRGKGKGHGLRAIPQQPAMTIIASREHALQARLTAALIAEFERQATIRSAVVTGGPTDLFVNGVFDLAEAARAALAALD